MYKHQMYNKPFFNSPVAWTVFNLSASRFIYKRGKGLLYNYVEESSLDDGFEKHMEGCE